MTMSPPRPRRAAAGLAVLVAGVFVSPLAAQMTRIHTVSVTIPSHVLASIVSVSPLTGGDREKAGDLYVLGHVTLQSPGPWHLQVRLTTPFIDMAGNSGKVKATNEVQALLANGSYATVTTDAWITIASGPATANLVKPVKYFIVWGKSSAKNPGLAVTIPVTYRVVSQSGGAG